MLRLGVPKIYDGNSRGSGGMPSRKLIVRRLNLEAFLVVLAVIKY